ncbi:MAG TPA: hypothetical protein VLK65_21460 [Vicinamibacteria bacterium]|nr:hypothetical protein [Vicinamibacteria bacterium]
MRAPSNVRFEHVMPRRWSRIIHGLPLPQSEGVLIDEANDRVLLRILPDETRGEEWWWYAASKGELLERLDPKRLEEGYPVDLRRLTVGSLLLGQWESETASRFRVLTPELATIFSREFTRRLEDPAPRTSSIASVTAAGFAIAQKEAGELVDFAVTPLDGRFLVTEAGRRPAPLPEDLFANAPELELPLLGTIDLGGSRGEELGRITDFDIDGKGRFGFVPCEPTRRSLKVVDQKGSVVADVPIELAYGTASCFLVAWLAEDTWVVAARNPGGDLARPIAVDIHTRQVRTFATLEGAYLSSLRGAKGRGVLILHGLSGVLRYLDPQGDELVHLLKDNNDERALFSPEDMDGIPDGGFAVLDVIRHVVQRFGSDGGYIDAIDLESVLGKEPGYPATLAASPDGRFAIWDFSAERPLILLTNGGALLAEWMPTYEDGSFTGNLQDLRYGPDGRLWATDGEALLRLNNDGVVDAVVGRRPEKNQLTEVSAAVRDAGGKFYLLDRRTASIHVFDPDGTFSHRCDPAPGDLDEQLDSAQLSVSGDGTVYLSNRDRDLYLLFDADGQRVERRPTRLDTIAEDWYAQPKGSDLWITTMEDLFLTDTTGNFVHRIRRHGDRTWLDSPNAAAVASDGTVALLTGERGFSSEEASLGVFTTDGEAVATRHFPGLDRFASIAFDADVIVLGTGNELLIRDRGGEPLGRFVPDSGYDRGHWSHFLSDEGRELQLLDTSARRVYRYDLSALR